jgi:flagellar biosynthesis protein FlhG
LDEVVVDGPHGVQIVSGANGLLEPTDSQAGVLHSLTALEREHDWLIIDTAGELPQVANSFARAADRVLIVTTPEPTSIAEAYAALKHFASANGPVVSAIVNRAESEQQALQILNRLRHAARSFLRTDLDRAGFVPDDSAVGRSVSTRRPLAAIDPTCPAQHALQELAGRFARTVNTRNETNYFQRLLRPFESSLCEYSLSDS